MSRQVRIFALTTVTLLVTRGAFIALDSAINGWRRRNLYQG